MQEDASYGGGDYAEATRTLAASEKLTLIDNTRLTAAKWITLRIKTSTLCICLI